MTDNLKESLSALIDDEASEIEVHRLVRQSSSDEGIKPSWVNYLTVRTVVRKEHVLSAQQHMLLNARISEAVAAEETYALGPELRGTANVRRYLAPAAGLAAAASLFAAVLITFNVQQGEPTDEVVSNQSTPAITATPVATNAPVFTDRPVEQGELRELDEERQRQLRAYLNQHDRMARMPNVRTVKFEQPEGK